ncbi:MAG TPA: cell division protein FtsA [Alphaproteobacteria bacterium]|nr:cell division protein FtsA [Alphaproteobacteria bacterium]
MSDPKTRTRRKSKGDTIAALDIGSSKICCLIARRFGQSEPQVMGLGHHISHGVRAGNIIDMEAAQNAINATLDAAEDMADEKIQRVVVNFSGGRLTSHHERLTVPLNGREAADEDIQRLFGQGQHRALDDESELLHLVPTDFGIDGQGNIRDPRGMAGENLSANLHMVTAQTAPIRTLLAALGRCNLQAEHVVISPYASGLSCLVEDEMSLGATVIDMGGGTTTIAVFQSGQMVHADSIPLGGIHITQDIARVLTTPLTHAERLKTLFGSAYASPSDDKEIIDVPQVGEEAPELANHIPKSQLIRIIQPRLEETFEYVNTRLQAASLGAHLTRRIVLTGGACQMPGVREMAGRLLDKQARIGRPLRLQGLSDTMSGPAFATTAGLLAFAVNPEAALPRFGQDLSGGEGLVAGVLNWLRNFV